MDIPNDSVFSDPEWEQRPNQVAQTLPCSLKRNEYSRVHYYGDDDRSTETLGEDPEYTPTPLGVPSTQPRLVRQIRNPLSFKGEDYSGHTTVRKQTLSPRDTGTITEDSFRDPVTRLTRGHGACLVWTHRVPTSGY